MTPRPLPPGRVRRARRRWHLARALPWVARPRRRRSTWSLIVEAVGGATTVDPDADRLD